MDKAAYYSLLTKSRYGVLSSVAADGTPQSALVGIAITPDLEIVFDTLSSSRKYRNLLNHPSCSFVIGWGGEQTIQYEGLAAQPKSADLRHYQEIYFATWTDAPAHLTWPGIAYFVVTPKWIRYSDYDQKPVLVEEIRF